MHLDSSPGSGVVGVLAVLLSWSEMEQQVSSSVRFPSDHLTFIVKSQAFPLAVV